MEASRVMRRAYTRKPYYTETVESTQSIFGLLYPSVVNLHPGLSTGIPCADYDWHSTDTLWQACSGGESVARVWKALDLEPIPGWEYVWGHNRLGLTLSVYVGDIKLAGPATNLHAGWDLIRKSGTDLDPPTPYSQYLGCGQQAYDVPQNIFDKR
eukprot:9222845-Pyramimonas_sp.AAC.1